MSSSSQELRVSGRSDEIQQGVTSRWVSSRVPFLNSLSHEIEKDLFLKTTKISCSTRQDLNLWNKNIRMDLSIIVSETFSSKHTLKDCNYRTSITNILNLDDNKVVCKKNYQWRKTFSEILRSEVHAKYEKWRELQDYEWTNSHCKKLWENHDTIAVHCYVSSQSVMIPSSRYILSRDKRMSLDTWHTSG